MTEGANAYTIQTYRVLLAKGGPPPRYIKNPKGAAQTLRCVFEELDQDREHFAVVALSSRNRVLGYKVCASGGAACAPLQADTVFRAALLLGAVQAVVGHNHPSGNPEPSSADRNVTRILVRAGRLLNVHVVDHVIVGADQHYSFADEGLILEAERDAKEAEVLDRQIRERIVRPRQDRS